jgi:hypothetical protein
MAILFLVRRHASTSTSLPVFCCPSLYHSGEHKIVVDYFPHQPYYLFSSKQRSYRTNTNQRTLRQTVTAARRTGLKITPILPFLPGISADFGGFV